MKELLSIELVAVLVLLTGSLVSVILLRPSLIPSTPGGRFSIFLGLFILPILSLQSGVQLHLEASKATEFCMSCHVMEPYGESLLADDTEMLPAIHFQNRRVDRNKACFDCHTQYTLFGDGRAKLTGLRHLFVYYTGQTPDELELYRPYHNRECLHCHEGARSFEEAHEDERTELVDNEISCLECHGSAHEIESIEETPKWKPSLAEVLRR